jgi:hypothetical protein
MPKRKIEPLTLNKIGAHCKDCTPERQSQNHHRCYVVSCACMYHRAYTARKPNAEISKPDPVKPHVPRSTLRTIKEIIRLHDLIDEILNNPEITIVFNWNNSNAKENMLIIKRTLCWVLQHDGGRWLTDNMQNVERALKELGFDLKEVQ